MIHRVLNAMLAERQPGRYLLPLCLLLAVVTGCAVPVPGPVLAPSVIPSPDREHCAPIDPAWTSVPANPCFHANRTAINEITLSWRVLDAGSQVYIYDDTGVIFEDIGEQPAVCPGATAPACAVTLPLEKAGYRRWLIRVEDGSDRVVHVAADLAVPGERSGVEVAGDGFVDVLADTGRSLHWRRSGENSLGHPGVTRSRLEVQEPGRLGWTLLDDSADPAAAGAINVPASLLREPANLAYRFRECLVTGDDGHHFCLEPVTAGFYAGSDRFLNWDNLYAPAGETLELRFTTLAGDERRLVSSTLLPQTGADPYTATVEDHLVIPGERVTPGRHVVSLRSCRRDTGACASPETLTVLVDMPVSWELGRDYREDFRQGAVHPVRGAGLPLAITHDRAGGTWLINEFSTSIEYIAPTGDVATFTLPLGRYPAADNTGLTATRPFAFPVPGNRFVPASLSAFAETATRFDTTLWFTQGGHTERADINNHSRVIAFDPSLRNTPATPYDDRICIYNVPADDEARHGNNAVIGLTRARGRIWIGESRGIWDQGASVISSFVPDPAACDNLLVFEHPGALANQRLQYCEAGRSPERDGCMARRVLEDQPRGLKVAHLATDTDGDAIWFSDAHGGYLGRLATDDGRTVQLYPIADVHAELGVFAGFTWSIAVDDEAVYVAEYLTRHILRFDKATSTFHEIEVPGLTSQVTLHSMDIDRKTNRLWFTLSNDPILPTDRTASTTGYIDLESWTAHLDDPADSEPVAGVLYDGQGFPGATGDAGVPHQNFTGIAVDPASGSVALASFHRGEVIELTPRKRFRP